MNVRLALKRGMDIVVSLGVGIVAAPVIGFIAFRVRQEMGTPVLFKQVRPGLGGAPFTLYKFRTMKDARDAHGNELSDSERLTAFGRRLRATSIDELPELWNVLRGDMSLVGPRPLLLRYLPYYTAREQLRHTMRPGITGWAQVNGRNTVSWDERLAMDVWYVEHHSLLLTAHLRREGIPDERIRNVGDVMYDATLQFGAKAERESMILCDLGLEEAPFVLATIHRAENTDDLTRLRVIFEALGTTHQELPVVLPLHPRTRHALERTNLLKWAEQQVRFIEPVGYLDMLKLEHHAKLIATDSGGIQKEAYFAGTPCVTLRDQTEWTELVELGWNRIAPPTNRESVVSHIQDALRAGPGRAASPYGQGDSARRIVSELVQRAAAS